MDLFSGTSTNTQRLSAARETGRRRLPGKLWFLPEKNPRVCEQKEEHPVAQIAPRFAIRDATQTYWMELYIKFMATEENNNCTWL